MKAYIVGYHQKHLIEVLLMSTTIYVSIEKQEKYQYFALKKSALYIL